MDPNRPPKLSIILVTPNSYETVRSVLACYRAQTVAKDIEVVLGSPDPEGMGIVESDFSGFHSWQRVQTPAVHNVGELKASAVAQAKADLIVFGEDHSFPLATWGEALIERHKGAWAAVGPRVLNLNSTQPQTWAQAYMEYGPWMARAGEGEAETLPGHNSSFKKRYLLEYQEELADMLLSEYNLFIDLRKAGRKLYYEPEAVIRHVNFESFFPLLQINFFAGRQFAAWRSKSFGLLRRLVYVIAFPVIPLVRFARIWRMMRKYRQPDKISMAVLLHLVINLVVDGAGQFVGYALGLGNTSADIFSYEFDRMRFVRDGHVVENVCE